MATENKYTGNNSTTNYAFTFPYIKEADVKCSLDGVLNTAFSLANATTVAFDSAPGTGVSVRVFRETDVATASATYFPGSAIKSEDLNDNHLQVLYASEEAQERAITSTGGVINGDITLSEDSTLTFEGATDDAYETKVTVVDPTADRTITIPNVTGTIVTTGDTGTVTAAMLAADSVDSSELVDGSIDTAHIADNAITADKIASNSVTASELASNAVTNAKIADAAVDTAELATNAVTTAIITDANVTTAKIANDAVTNDKIGDAAVNRDQLASDSIITVKITDGNVTTAKIAADAITGAKIADDAINSEHYTDGSIDTAHIADANVTTAKIADDAVTTAKIPDSNITQGKLASPCVVANHINSNAVTTAKINNSAVTEAKIADDAVTAAKIADGAITSAHIAADTVVAADIAANAVGASELADNAVDTAAIATDAVTGAKIADDAIDSEHYTDGSIDLAHMSANSVDSDQYVDGSIDLAHMSANSVDSDQYVDGSIDEAHIANDAVSLAKLAGIARGKLIYGDASGNPAVLAVGSNGQVLKTDGTDVEWGDDVASGGAGTFTVADESSDTTCFPVFVTAATGTLGPKSDSQLTYNSSSGALGATTLGGTLSTAAQTNITSTGTLTGLTVSGDVHFDNGADAGKDILWDVSADALIFNDNVKAIFGTSSDGVEIYHSGSNSFIIDNGTGDLKIRGAEEIHLQDTDSGEYLAKFIKNGAVELYYNNVKKFETTSTGVSVSGSVSVDAGTNTTQAIFSGSGGSGARGLAIVTEAAGAADEGVIFNARASGTTATMKFQTNSATALTIQGEGDEIDIPDGTKLRFGDSNDLQIYHDGSNSRIEDGGTGYLAIRSNDIRFENPAANEALLYITENGSCDLMYDNSKKLETTSGGVTVTGNAVATSKFRGNDSVKVSLGDSEDLVIEHDGSNSTIVNKTGRLIDYVNTNEIAIDRNPNGSVDLYYDNVLQTKTTSTGIHFADEKRADFGTGTDLKIFSDGTNGVVTATNGRLYLQSDTGVNFTKVGNAETLAIFNENGSCDLYYDNAKKLETVTGGVTVTGVCTATSFAGSGANLTGISAGNTPAFAATDTDGTSIANATYTALTFDTEVLDSDSAFASSAFTVPTDEGGNYWISYSAAIDSIDDGKQAQGVIYKDTGSGYAEYVPSFVYNKSPANGAELTVAWSGIMALSAGDAIKVYVRHNNGVGATENIKIQGGLAMSTFQGFKVS